MRWSKKSVFLPPFILFFLSIPLFSQANDSQTPWSKQVLDGDTFTGKVVGVADGDTMSIMREVQLVKVHLAGIDCPEEGQAFGTQAKQFTSDMAFDKNVKVQVRNLDRHGRIVGEVVLPDGTILNHELVSTGLAWWYRKHAPDDLILRALEAEAREAKRGLWAGCCPVPPWEWRTVEGDRRTKK